MDTTTMTRLTTCPGRFRDFLDAPSSSRAVTFAWLGQAGFAFRYREVFFLVDPYLSDFLAKKYAGTRYPHLRMMAPPIKADELRGLAAVFCTHRHSDHMDPGSLPTISHNNEDCHFVVPRSQKQAAIDIGLAEPHLVPVDDRDIVLLSREVTVRAVPSAHEILETDDAGAQHYLGYIMKIGPYTIYHPGDCVPFEKQAKTLRKHHIDVALLPINGRDESLRSSGVPGNMSFDEALALCRECNIPHLVPHHFEMFDFNTVPRNELQQAADKLPEGDVQVQLPELDRYFILKD